MWSPPRSAQAYVGAFLRRNANARPTTAAAAMQDELLCKRLVCCCQVVDLSAASCAVGAAQTDKAGVHAETSRRCLPTLLP